MTVPAKPQLRAKRASSEGWTELVVRAQAGDLDAFGRLVRMTQAMAHGVARGVLRDPAAAQDAVQDAYLSAFRRLRGLEEPAAFVVWLRRIVITTSLNLRRSRRRTLLRLDDVPEVPILDEAETRWTDLQRERLAGALLTLTAAERQLCDRRYHGQWSTARLAASAGVDETAMRKRLQLFTAGKCYRQCRLDAMHLDAFHQAETFWLGERARLTPWMVTAKVLESVDAILPGRTVKIVPTQYAMCSQAWELEVETDGRWSEVLAWGVFTDKIVAHLGGDPAVHTTIGAGCGLERLAMVRYGIDDARKIAAAQVA